MHVTRITKPGASHPIEPQSVVLLDPATGAPSLPMSVEQLRAQPLAVLAQTRTCLATELITGLSTTVAATLPSIPVGAVTAEIQADGGTVRVRRDGQAPTAVRGWRIDDGLEKTVDSSLANVRLLAMAANVNVQITYFDRV